MASAMFKRSTQSVQRNGKFLAYLKGVLGTFSAALTGIADEAHHHAYITLTLERVLLLFFLQEQRLLDGNPHYLQDHLAHLQSQQADTFFVRFFLPLCHHIRNRQTDTDGYSPVFGQLPVLALPLLKKNVLEETYFPDIPDAAFARLFAFLQTYRWQLTTTTQQGSEAVQHSIFADLLEQRSDQKLTGTYYTTDDVTIYIAQKTIVPALLQRLTQHGFMEMGPEGMIWQQLGHSPDRYISAPLQQQEFLPEETLAEYHVRRQHYDILYTLLQAGGVRDVQTMITWNLDLVRLVVDMITAHPDTRFILVVFREVEQLTILDPTCGSGAFLFAALTVLQTLYAACIDRLYTLKNALRSKEGIVIDDEQVQALLTYISGAPNILFFIVEHIITHNLYGVDLAEEATDTCALRLYLALLAHTHTSNDVPRFDHLSMHIRTGNALVGDIKFVQHKVVSPSIEAIASEQISSLAMAEVTLPDFSSGLVDVSFGYKKSMEFHWHLAFPEVARRGGFVVIVGNPPYIEYNKVRQQYEVEGYSEKSYGNLHAAMLERSLALLHPTEGHLGLILPMSICSSQRFAHVRTILQHSLSSCWLAHFDIFPCRLFSGAFQRLTLLLAKKNSGNDYQQTLHTTRIHRWYPDERPFLIDLIKYNIVPLPPSASTTSLAFYPKIASPVHAEILQKIMRQAGKQTLATIQTKTKTPHFVYYQEATNYWVKALCHLPFYQKNGVARPPAHGRIVFFEDADTAYIIMALLNSSLFYLWFSTYSDGFHLAHMLVTTFPLVTKMLSAHQLTDLGRELEADLLAHTRLSTRNTRQPFPGRQHLKIELTEYYAHYSKPLIDTIDRLLASYYDMTPEELDFVIHYDIKYRMGRDKNR